MPPRKPKLPASVIADFERWIDRGAIAPSGGQARGSGPPSAEARGGTGPSGR